MSESHTLFELSSSPLDPRGGEMAGEIFHMEIYGYWAEFRITDNEAFLQFVPQSRERDESESERMRTSGKPGGYSGGLCRYNLVSITL